jgi:outer membrane autotransporter protein
VLDVAFGSLDLRRTLVQSGLDQARAVSQAFNAGLHLRTAYTVAVDSFYVEPAIELDANYVRINGYTEKGAAPFNLKVNALEDVVLAATPDLRIGSRIELGPRAAAKVYVGGGISFLHGNKFEVDARFASVSSAAGNFRSTFNNDSVVGRFTAGIDIHTLAGIELSIQYQGRHSHNQTEHGGQARLTYRF